MWVATANGCMAGVLDVAIDGHGLMVDGPLSIPVFSQVKRWSGNVSSATVRDFRGAIQGRGHVGMVFTTGTFTEDAKAEARRTQSVNTQLFDGVRMADWLKDLPDHRRSWRFRAACRIVVHRVVAGNLLNRKPLRGRSLVKLGAENARGRLHLGDLRNQRLVVRTRPVFEPVDTLPKPLFHPVNAFHEPVDALPKPLFHPANAFFEPVDALPKPLFHPANAFFDPVDAPAKALLHAVDTPAKIGAQGQEEPNDGADDRNDRQEGVVG